MEHFHTEKKAPERPPIESTGLEKQRSYALEPSPATETPPKKSTSQKPAAPETKTRPETTETAASLQARIVEFRSGEAVIRHPALRDLLDDGWRIKSAVPHLEDSDEVKLLVMLTRS